MIVTWFIVRQASRIDKFISAEGAVIVTQLLGFLPALAVEIGSAGIRELFLISWVGVFSCPLTDLFWVGTHAGSQRL